MQSCSTWDDALITGVSCDDICLLSSQQRMAELLILQSEDSDVFGRISFFVHELCSSKIPAIDFKTVFYLFCNHGLTPWPDKGTLGCATFSSVLAMCLITDADRLRDYSKSPSLILDHCPCIFM